MPYLTLDPGTGRVVRDQYSLGYAETIEYDELEGLKKRLRRRFKKYRRRARKAYSWARKIQKKSILYKFHRRVRKKVKPYVRKLAPIVIPVAGAVLAPFTGGASVAAATLVTSGLKLYEKRKAAKEAYKAQKAEAAQIAAEEAAYSRKLEAEADKLYAGHTALFVKNGYPPEAWKKMNVDMKLAVIDRINRATKQGAKPPEPVQYQTCPGGVTVARGEECPRTPPKVRPTYTPVPVDKRYTPKGRMGDPAVTNPVEVPGCPKGYVAQMEGYMGLGENVAHYGPVSTSVRFGGAGGYMITSPTPRQKIFIGSEETADLIAPRRRQKKIAVNSRRRSYGLWKTSPIRLASLISPPEHKRTVSATRRSYGLWKIAPFSKAAMLEGMGEASSDPATITRAREAQQLHYKLLEAANAKIADRGVSDDAVRQVMFDVKNRLDGLQYKYINDELRRLGVAAAHMLNPTNPDHAVVIAVRGDIRNTRDMFERLLSQAKLQRRILKLKPTWVDDWGPLFEGVPTWVYVAVGGALALAIFVKK